ncbi:DNA glycosylase [Corynebacterium falsenii DSM 44353]|uniref:Fpg/Nei family DNA glycosylase n=1 Tax=Corynebacterium falsenii TaxID=108486 RepID=UPI0003E93661|nr:zinc finger domain-containing protein [Corynebacterium falsenii]AHI02554.1 DNA glycosylase [Corynebacterium falsenii DSM 44353]UBI05336.1 Fpg/Nei family DNA glycosylase [Corynebacterium falsenii]UBI06683.1 Fpg/Nei family DNA glycosylase [Corynebacterium falsenii]
MPEGHVIHRLARLLNDAFAGEPVSVSSPQGTFAQQAAQLDGHVLERAEAWGKHLFIHFAPGNGGASGTVGGAGAVLGPERIVHIHLGLIGTFRLQPADVPVTGQIRLLISDGTTVAHLHGPQWCRLITEEERDAAVAKLGADPLRPTDPDNLATLDDVHARVARSKRSLGSLLMDQKLYAGVGNIYRAEVLFLLGISPDRAGVGASREDKEQIWELLTDLMAQGEASGRIDTVRPEHTPEAMGREPRKDDHGGEVYVYRRAGQPCLVCGTPIATAVVEGRNLFWCPTCQAE